MRAVTAIIVNYRTTAVLPQCIDAILTAVEQIIVVDNDSREPQLHELEQRYLHVRWIHNHHNRGFAAAVNQAAAVADTEHDLLIINPDCQLPAAGLQQLKTCLADCPQGALVAPLLHDSNGQEQSGSRRHLPTPLRVLRYAMGQRQAIDLRQQALPQQPQAMPAVGGACMLLKRTAWLRSAGMDEGFFLHFEDLDLMYRLQQAGYQVLLEPRVVATHIGGLASRTAPLRVLWHKHRSLQRYLLKHFPRNPLCWTVLPGINLLHLLLSMLANLVSRRP